MKMFSKVSIVAIIACGVCGCPQQNGDTPQATMFSANLTGDQEVPAATTNGSGSGTFTLNADKTQLTFSITASGLSGPVTAAHFHMAPTGTAGQVVFDVGSFVTDSNGQVTIDGTWDISAADVSALEAGNIYINIHTAQNPPGEIRGQLTAQ